MFGVGEGQVSTAARERNHQFDLVLKVPSFRGVGDISGCQSIDWLGEEKRGLASGIGTHLASVIGVITSDTVNAVWLVG
jgi:hypothetical protein